MFNPARPFLLYAAFRRMEPILCWDLRGDVSRPVEIFSTLTPPIDGKTRRILTNQRLRFDVDYSGKWLAVGDEVSRPLVKESSHGVVDMTLPRIPRTHHIIRSAVFPSSTSLCRRRWIAVRIRPIQIQRRETRPSCSTTAIMVRAPPGVSLCVL